MEPQKMVDRLEDLIRDRQSFMQDNYPESNKIYEDDIEALEQAIRKIEHFDDIYADLATKNREIVEVHEKLDNAQKVIEDKKRLIEEQQCRIGKLHAIVSDLISYI